MTNIDRKGVWAIVLGSLAVAALIFFAWATSGFQNWVAASWFNYWGNGSPVAARVAEESNEQNDDSIMVMTSANAGLTYDSDDAVLTATVSKFETPSVSLDSTYIYFFVRSSNNTFVDPYKMRINVDDVEKDFVITYNLYTSYDNVYDGVKFTYEQFASEFNLTKTESSFSYINAFVLACLTDDYLASDVMSKSLYVPPLDMLTIDKSISFEGTKLKVRLPYDYYYYDSSMSFGVHQLKIFISSQCSFVHSGSVAYSLNQNGGKTYYDYSSNFTTDTTNPFSLNTEVSGQHYYEVDLAKLNFVNELQSNCGVRILCYWTGSGFIPDIILHPFDCNMQREYDSADFYFSVKKLDSPKNLSYKSGTLSWSAVEGACGYAVFDGDNCVTSDTPNISVDVADVSAGEHTFRVRALGNVGKSLSEVQTAGVMTASMLNAYNASSNIVQLVTLTYNVNGDTITKFVPYGSTVAGYIYDVEFPNKEFGGWYYDEGFSRKVDTTDTLNGDTVIYARLSDKKVTERQLSWWEQNKWYVLIPCFVLAGIVIVAAVIVTIRKKKAEA